MAAYIVVCTGNPDIADAYYGAFDSTDQAEQFIATESATCPNEHIVEELQ
jgi:hypothetical protein